MQLQPGDRLGPYEIVAPLGAGGMGEVYRARDPRLDREVAVKVLPSAASQDRDRLQRFQHEARAASALDHPNILAVHDVGSHDGVPYLVCELLEGETLRHAIRGARLTTAKAVGYAAQVADGLAAAHERASPIATSSPRTSS
jgi:eukaryotic-like serine/threonine-protein kinase